MSGGNERDDGERGIIEEALRKKVVYGLRVLVKSFIEGFLF